MIRVENIETWGFEHAIRGMRNPMNSWDKSDSAMCLRDMDDCKTEPACHCPKDGDFEADWFCIGKNDLCLMKRLFKGGSEHRKYLRQIFVSMDITAPLYWWKEFDTYKVGTAANSCSTMHKIHSKPFTLDDFSHDRLDYTSMCCLETLIDHLNYKREEYNRKKDKNEWWNMIQLLPTSYNQKRTVTMNYENVVSMIHQRENHKLDEWNEFVDILKGLPYVKEIMGKDKE